jgi:transposase
MTDGTTTMPLVYVGLDVHVATIAIAVARGTATPETLTTIRNAPGPLRKALAKLGAPGQLRVCYEAGPCGYTVARDLAAHDIDCVVIAPSMTPRVTGDRVKTDRRDALKLARLLRSGDLTLVTQPTVELEALRDLSRLREQAIGDLHRARQRLVKFLIRHGITQPTGSGRWSKGYHAWLETLVLEPPTLQAVLREYWTEVRDQTTRRDRVTGALEDARLAGAEAPVVAGLERLHGIGAIAATGVVAELGDLTRFTSPDQLTAYAGLVPQEHSSGRRVQRGGITKTGNAHVRWLLIEAAWHYTRPYHATPDPGRDDPIAQLVWTVRQRLTRRFGQLLRRGKPRAVAIVAIARELLKACWALARLVRQGGTRGTGDTAEAGPARPALVA